MSDALDKLRTETAHEIAKARENGIMDTLVALGWTTPADSEALRTKVERLERKLDAAPHSGGCNIWRDFDCDCWKSENNAE